MSSFARFLNQTVIAFRLTLPSFVGSSSRLFPFAPHLTLRKAGYRLGR